MNKFEKIIREDITKKKLVLNILELLNGESYEDSAEILAVAVYFLKKNSYVDFELAKDIIENVSVEGD